MLATHSRSGPGGRKSRSRRSPATRTPGTRIVVPPRRRRGRGFFQDVALLTQHPDLAFEPSQLLALLAAQALGAAIVDVELATPVTQRLRRDP